MSLCAAAILTPATWRSNGAEQLRKMLTGDAPQPPMTRLTGLRLIDAEPGTATFELPLAA